MMAVDNPNVFALAKKLETIPNVLQVRFWAPLKSGWADFAQQGGLLFCCLTDDLINGADRFQLFQAMIPGSVINNEELHQAVVDNLTGVVEHYFQTKEFPHDTNWTDQLMKMTQENVIQPSNPNPPQDPPQNP